MTLSEIIPSILNSVFDNRVWQDATPDDLPRDNNGEFLPFCIWTTIGGQDSEYVDQTMSDHMHARVQIHANVRSGRDADLLMQNARDALLASIYTVGVLGSPIGTYDASRKLRGRKQQFSIWFRQPVTGS